MVSGTFRGARSSGGYAPAGGPLAVEIRGVSKRFGATRALNDVSLGFSAGEVHCLLGENGAGKSTVGKIIAGLYEPDEGEVRVCGKPVSLRTVAVAREHGIAIVFQELSLAPDLSVRENICLGTERERSALLLRRRAEEAYCRSLVRELDVAVDLDARVRDLSIANQQMVEIVKALAVRARVLILDEPTAMLGAVEKKKLFEILRRLKNEGTAFVFITHHIEEVIEIGDRVSIMKDGSLVASFPIDDAVDADVIVERLAGKRAVSANSERRHHAADEVLCVKHLPGRNEATAEIRVRRGEIVGLYGVVGCGREQIIRALVGLGSLPGASIILDGADYRPRDPAAAARRGVAFLPSGRAGNCILPTRSIRENLMLTQLAQVSRKGVLVGSAERAAAGAQLARLRVRFGSQEDAITSLSGGNQQKVMLGRSLAHARRLLILEDPTAGIDIAAKQEIHGLIRERADEGLSVLFVSSDLAETLSLCDVVYTIFRGRVVGEYRPPSAADEPAIIAEILGSADAASRAPVRPPVPSTDSMQVRHADR